MNSQASSFFKLKRQQKHLADILWCLGLVFSHHPIQWNEQMFQFLWTRYWYVFSKKKRQPKQLHKKKSSDILQEITVGQALWFATWRDFFPTIWRSLITSLVGFLQRFLRFAQTAAIVVSRRLAQVSNDYEFVQNFKYFCKSKNKNCR